MTVAKAGRANLQSKYVGHKVTTKVCKYISTSMLVCELVLARERSNGIDVAVELAFEECRSVIKEETNRA